MIKDKLWRIERNGILIAPTSSEAGSVKPSVYSQNGSMPVKIQNRNVFSLI